MNYVYMVTNWCDSVLYIGVTSNLPKRLYEHKNGLADGFTKKYNAHKLVYYEESPYLQSAFAREKQLKKWTKCTCQHNEPNLAGSVVRLGIESVRRSFDALTLTQDDAPLVVYKEI